MQFRQAAFYRRVLWLMAWLWCVASPALAGDGTRVLMLVSYHPGMAWSDAQLAGVRAALEGVAPQIDLQILTHADDMAQMLAGVRQAIAMEVAGFEFNGYSRGGPVFNHEDGVKGNLTLGGELRERCARCLRSHRTASQRPSGLRPRRGPQPVEATAQASAAGAQPVCSE
mgnify:CR=1 FL=1